MVGYRDLSDAQRFEVFDFGGASQAPTFRAFLGGVRATGGGDSYEDVLGGLQVRSS